MGFGKEKTASEIVGDNLQSDEDVLPYLSGPEYLERMEDLMDAMLSDEEGLEKTASAQIPTHLIAEMLFGPERGDMTKWGLQDHLEFAPILAEVLDSGELEKVAATGVIEDAIEDAKTRRARIDAANKDLGAGDKIGAFMRRNWDSLKGGSAKKANEGIQTAWNADTKNADKKIGRMGAWWKGMQGGDGIDDAVRDTIRRTASRRTGAALSAAGGVGGGIALAKRYRNRKKKY